MASKNTTAQQPTKTTMSIIIDPSTTMSNENPAIQNHFFRMDHTFITDISPKTNLMNGCEHMTNCPKCGKKVPENGWTMTTKSNETGKKTDITFGMCQDCSLIVILKMQKSE